MKAALSVIGAVFAGGVLALLALVFAHRSPVGDDDAPFGDV